MLTYEGVFSQLPHRVVRVPPRLPTFAAENKVTSDMNGFRLRAAFVALLLSVSCLAAEGYSFQVVRQGTGQQTVVRKGILSKLFGKAPAGKP